jgi:hypothetical protein
VRAVEQICSVFLERRRAEDTSSNLYCDSAKPLLLRLERDQHGIVFTEAELLRIAMW